MRSQQDITMEQLIEDLTTSWSIPSKDTITLTFFSKDIAHFIEELLKLEQSISTQLSQDDSSKKQAIITQQCIQRICDKLHELDHTSTMCSLMVNNEEYQLLLPIFYAL